MPNEEMLSEVLGEDTAYYKLPVIFWKEIMQEGPKNVYNRRPAKMHRTLSLRSASIWIERFFGIPADKIDFVGVKPEDWDTKNVRDLQPEE